jgi:hypothetical protein
MPTTRRLYDTKHTLRISGRRIRKYAASAYETSWKLGAPPRRDEASNAMRSTISDPRVICHFTYAKLHTQIPAGYANSYRVNPTTHRLPQGDPSLMALDVPN